MKHDSKQFKALMEKLDIIDDAVTDYHAREGIAEPTDKDKLAYLGSTLDETEVGNVDRLLAKYGTRIAYTQESGWLVYDGKHWNRKTGKTQIKGVGMEVVRHIPSEVKYLSDADKVEERLKFARTSGRSSSVKGMISLAESATQQSLDDFDCDPNLWNAKNGTIDLTTGKLRDFSPDDRLTVLGGISYDPKAKCDLFLKTLAQILCDDEELLDFFQVLCGYSMYGHQNEQILVFFTGNEKDAKKNGSNGKSLLLSIIEDIHGENHKAMDTALITEDSKGGNNLNNDVAALSRVRLATGTEFNRNDKINEKRLKQFSGEDKISARFLHQEFFDFAMKALMIFATNYVPMIQSQDDGIFRRMVEIPFNAKFYDERNCPEGGIVKDPSLKKKLKAEYKGILAWMVEGAVRYHNEGLKIPEKLYLQREQKKAEVNPLHDFMTMCLDRGDDKVEQAGQLYKAYKTFIELNGGVELTSTAFGRRLNDETIVVDEERSKRYKYRRGAALNKVGIAYTKGINGLKELDEMENKTKNSSE